jgi:hypothetical protein
MVTVVEFIDQPTHIPFPSKTMLANKHIAKNKWLLVGKVFRASTEIQY